MNGLSTKALFRLPSLFLLKDSNGTTGATILEIIDVMTNYSLAEIIPTSPFGPFMRVDIYANH